MQITDAKPADYDALAQVMYEAIHAQPSPYTAAERAAWAPKQYAGQEWADRITGQDIWLAQDDLGIVGFMTLKQSYIDFAYLLPRARGTGCFRALYERLEAKARRHNVTRLTVHASLAAQPAFAAMGFGVVKHEEVERAGQRLRRAEMEKRLETTDDT